MKNNKEIFVFIGGQNILKGVFDSHNIKFLENMYKHDVIKHKLVLLTFICNEELSNSEQKKLEVKKKLMCQIAEKYKFQLDFYQVKGRTIKDLFVSSNEIFDFILEKGATKVTIWSHNYLKTFMALKGKIC